MTSQQTVAVAVGLASMGAALVVNLAAIGVVIAEEEEGEEEEEDQ